jgi:hypothetical protein
MKNTKTLKQMKQTYCHLIMADFGLDGRACKERALQTIRKHFGEENYHYHVHAERWPHYTGEFYLPSELRDKLVPLSQAAFELHDFANEKDNPSTYIHIGTYCAGWGLKDENKALWDYYRTIAAKEYMEKVAQCLADVHDRALAVLNLQKTMEDIEHKYPGMINRLLLPPKNDEEK